LSVDWRSLRRRAFRHPVEALATPGLLVLLVYTVGYFQRAWSIITFPFGYDYGETPELARALAVARGERLYQFWDSAPYQMANYPPLFPLLNGLFTAVFGPQYQSGRLINWVAGLIIGAVLAWLAWRESNLALAPMVTGLLWFSSFYVWDWTPLGREDDLAIAVSLAGLAIFAEFVVRRSERPRNWLPSLACFVVAVFIRQTVVDAAVASCVYLFLREPRRGIGFAGLFAVAFVGGSLTLNLMTRGAYLLDVVVGNLNPFSWLRVLAVAEQFVALYPGAVLLAGCYVIGQIGRKGQPLFVVWLGATFLVALTAGKEGAAENYELLPWAATSLTAGLGVAWLRSTSAWWGAGRSRRRRFGAGALAFGVGLVLLLQAQLAFHLPYVGPWTPEAFDRASVGPIPTTLRTLTETGWYRWLVPGAREPAALERENGRLYQPMVGPADQAAQAHLNQLVAATPGDLIDEDMTHLLLAGKRIYLQPFEFSEQARAGRWDQQPLVDRLASGAFPLVILTTPLTPDLQSERFTPDMYNALRDRYCFRERVGQYYLYQPC
jgi:hypothetical protein